MIHGGGAALSAIRSAFPALTRIHNGNPVAYFDGPGGTQVPRVVVEAMAGYLLEHNANTHWEYPTSAETDAIIESSRAVLAAFLGCEPNEVVFGANMTTLTFHIARALSWEWSAGDEVVVTQLDHQANVAPWVTAARERGVLVRRAPFDPATGELRMAELARLMTPRTRVVAIGGASNALGTVNPLDEIVKMARGVDALVYVDAVHAAAHFLQDARGLDCDFLATSAYKFYGPHIGVLYARAGLMESLAVPRLDPAPSAMPERLETGTGNHEGIAGAAAAVEFIASCGVGNSLRERLQSALAAAHRRGASLTERLWEGLHGIPGVRVYGPTPERPRTPTVSFTVDGVPGDEVARALAAQGVFVSHGDFYASTVIDALGVGEAGVVRAGAALYTDADEVERLLIAVNETARRR